MRVAAFQFAPVVGEVDRNLQAILDATDEAHRLEVDLLVAPEMSLTGWNLDDADLRSELTRVVEERCLPALAAAAAATGMGILVGGPIGLEQASNGAVLLAPDGGRVDYQKVHLFGPERDWWAPGSESVVASVAGYAVGVTICYDAEFPEMPRLTRLAGAELIAVPTTNMDPYERDQAVIFAARAIENECPVVVANRVGSERGWTYFGRSLVLDARGRVIAEAGRDRELLVATVEPAVPDPDLSYLARRRPEVYAPLADPSLVPSSKAAARSPAVASRGGLDA